MRLKVKLFLGFGTIMLISVAFFGLVISMLYQQKDHLDNVVKRNHEMVRLASIIETETNNTARMLRGHLLELNDQVAPESFSEIEKSRLAVKTSIEALAALAEENETKTMVAKVRAANDRYTEVVREVFTLQKAGKKSEAAKVLIKDYEYVRLEIFRSAGELKAHQEKAMVQRLESSEKLYEKNVTMIVAFVCVVLLVGAGVSVWVLKNITGSLTKLTDVLKGIDLKRKEHFPRVKVSSNDEIGEISKAYNGMADALESYIKQEKEFNQAIQDQNWLKSKIAEIANMNQKHQDLFTLAESFLSKIVPLVGANYGSFYIQDENDKSHQSLTKLASYADSGQTIGVEGFRIGEGLVGQCAIENKKILIDKIPKNYIIKSGLGAATPTSLILMPAAFEGKVLAVVELASFGSFNTLQMELLEEVFNTLGTTINRVQGRRQIEKLLAESQALTEELQTQSEELNVQQEELKSINEKLEEQHKKSEKKTKELEKTKAALEETNKQVVLASKYKSEFLANISHELRTPLNSLLILAQMLAANNEGNLTPKQVEYLNTIHHSGVDLLKLINDILDLSKIESGKIEIFPDELTVEEVKEFLEKQFNPVANRKGVDFSVDVAADSPVIVWTDGQRLMQILQNLISNAFKFTEVGEVAVSIKRTEDNSTLAFSIRDTGIGIPEDKQELIFEAFKQADGTIGRKYGGTGLGLSISRELARLLGGFIELKSTAGKGSTFTLYIPIRLLQPSNEMLWIEEEVAAGAEKNTVEIVEKEFEKIESVKAIKEADFIPTNLSLEGRKILLVDDDMRNVYALTTALEKHLINVVFAENGKEAIKMLEEDQEIELVLMDIMMPEMDGYQAMKEIRKITKFAELPIVALTAKAMKNDRKKCIEAGASDYISKPVNLDQLLSLIRVWLQ